MDFDNKQKSLPENPPTWQYTPYGSNKGKIPAKETELPLF